MQMTRWTQKIDSLHKKRGRQFSLSINARHWTLSDNISVIKSAGKI
jgi:hypothetical protein